MIINKFFSGLLLMAFVFFCAKAIVNHMDRPAVHMSYSTGECVEVRNFRDGDHFDCYDLPSTYEHVWVQ